MYNDDLSVSREQVLVLLNFGMIDFSSQERTCPNNPVDLNYCQSHQSYYTCLSRSADVDGTIIVQDFDPGIITGGTSSHLKQEFRELEILDEITKLHYERSLPDHINGNRCNVLICQFQEWKGNDYVPPGVHATIRWDKHDLFQLLNVVTDYPWNILKPEINKPKVKKHKSDTIGFVAARGFVPIPSFTLSQKKCKT